LLRPILYEILVSLVHICIRLCDPEEAMKILFAFLAVLVVAVSLVADYKWRQWMAARRRDRQ